MLSESLHDREQNGDAAKVLESLATAMDADPQVLQGVRKLARNPESVRARMDLFFSNAAAPAGDRAKQTADLEKAIAADPTDVDVLADGAKWGQPLAVFG